MSMKERDHEVTFEIRDHLGILSTSNSGWNKELNMVAWNGCSEKFDLRDWDREHRTMSRGITMTREETKALLDILSSIDFS